MYQVLPTYPSSHSPTIFNMSGEARTVRACGGRPPDRAGQGDLGGLRWPPAPLGLAAADRSGEGGDIGVRGGDVPTLSYVYAG